MHSQIFLSLHAIVVVIIARRDENEKKLWMCLLSYRNQKHMCMMEEVKKFKKIRCNGW